ncbi:TPA: hypothetical protein ACQ301_003147 [Yersinia enterocolitica]
MTFQLFLVLNNMKITGYRFDWVGVFNSNIDLVNSKIAAQGMNSLGISAEVNGDNSNIKMSGGELTSSTAAVRAGMVRHVISQRWQWTIMPVGLARQIALVRYL